jgi:hypothetical protein
MSTPPDHRAESSRARDLSAGVPSRQQLRAAWGLILLAAALCVLGIVLADPGDGLIVYQIGLAVLFVAAVLVGAAAVSRQFAIADVLESAEQIVGPESMSMAASSPDAIGQGHQQATETLSTMYLALVRMGANREADRLHAMLSLMRREDPESLASGPQPTWR